MGAVTNQGITTHILELFRIEDNQWISIPVCNLPLKDNYGYALSSDNDLLVFDMQYFDTQYGRFEPEPPEFVALLKWDKTAETFKLKR